MLDIDRWLVYEEFVQERHLVWARRQDGGPGPWTTHHILSTRKFTNVFRVLDPGSQFVLTDLYGDDRSEMDALARVLLYRHTNHPQVWGRLREDFGHYPGFVDMTHNRSVGLLGGLLNSYKDQGMPVFNPAYLIFPGTVKGANKVESVLARVRGFLEDRSVAFLTSRSLREQVDALRGYPGIGDFIAMQVATDFNYHSRYGHDWENDFILAGPGAVRGARFLDPASKPETTIRTAQKYLLASGGWCPRIEGRGPSLMDTQNTLCELSKLARYLNSPPGRAYEPAHPGAQEPPVFPEHWFRPSRV